jgi:hypothetical protein
MLILYEAADYAATVLFLVLGSIALFYQPLPGDPGRRSVSPEKRRLVFRALGCIFCAWGWARVFDWLALLG